MKWKLVVNFMKAKILGQYYYVRPAEIKFDWEGGI